MAAGFIKVRKDLTTDPTFLLLASKCHELVRVTFGDKFACHSSSNYTLGALVYLWCYADEHIDENDVIHITPQELDHAVGLPGFCAAMPKRWLQVTPDGYIKLPKYREDNGSYKQRKDDAAARQRKSRESKKVYDSDPSHIVTFPSRNVTAIRPDQNKERKSTLTSAKKKGARLPDDWTMSPDMRAFAADLGIADPEAEAAMFRDYWRAAPGDKGRKLDWLATWRVWCRTEAKRRQEREQSRRSGTSRVYGSRPTQESALTLIGGLNADDDDDESTYTPPIYGE